MPDPSWIILPILLFFFLSPVAGHGFIKSWAADDHAYQKAQKQPLSETAFRDAPSNIGWIGSKFIDSPAFVCGSSDTPKDKVAPPGGTLFSSPEQSAKKTLPVTAGGKVSLIVAGNPGEGFPHHTGHVLAYLGYCGKSQTACQNFDAAATQYHRIQAEVDGISNKLIKQYSPEQDGDRWDVPIPKDIVNGSYILRVELVAFGQSGPQEGLQDQYYVYCGQIAVEGGTGLTPVPNDDHPTVKFPGAYKPGNISPKSLPTLKQSFVANSTSKDSKTKIESKSVDTDDLKTSSSLTPPPGCADRCYKKKLTELQTLAPSCSPDQFDCLCQSSTFVKAYQNCCNDHCQGFNETRTAVAEIYDKCASAKSFGESNVTSPAVSQSTTRSEGSSGTDQDDLISGRADSTLAGTAPNPTKDAGGSSREPNVNTPSACNAVCYKAKMTKSELDHLAPSCAADDLDCLCRSHKWVCSYAQCAKDNCASQQEAEKAADEIYALCGARLSSPNRIALPSTDYIPFNLNPSSSTRSKSQKCSQFCLRQIASKSACTSPNNLNCICKNHADVCAWAKCAEDRCFDEVDAIRIASDDIYDQCSKP